jgi:hypothetical protein
MIRKKLFGRLRLQTVQVFGGFAGVAGGVSRPSRRIRSNSYHMGWLPGRRGGGFGGLPDTIKSPAGAANLWRAFAEAMKKAKAPASEAVTAV